MKIGTFLPAAFQKQGNKSQQDPVPDSLGRPDAGFGSLQPTKEELKSGFWGASRTRLEAALNAGFVVGSLSFLTPSDIDLIRKTTGITIKDGGYFNADGTPAGASAEADSAAKLAQSLSEMRTGSGDTGAPFTAEDLESYLKIYADQASKDKLKFDVIRAAEVFLKPAR